MRNGMYTVYRNLQFELGRTMQGNYELIHIGNQCPFSDFVKYKEGIFIKAIEKEQVTNAFLVYTEAQYKGFIFNVDNAQNDMYLLSTDDERAYRQLKLDFIERGYYQKWVPRSEIEKMWEKRRKSDHDFPMPESIKAIVEIETQ